MAASSLAFSDPAPPPLLVPADVEAPPPQYLLLSWQPRAVQTSSSAAARPLFS